MILPTTSWCNDTVLQGSTVYLSCTSQRAGSPGRSLGGAGKERRACNYVSGIWISASKKSMRDSMRDADWGRPNNDLSRVFQCLFTFVLVPALRWLTEIWQLSLRRAKGELKAEFKFQRRSCKLNFLFPPQRQNAPESLLVGYTINV